MFKKIFALIVLCIFISGCYGDSSEVNDIYDNQSASGGQVSLSFARHESGDINGFLAGVGQGKFRETSSSSMVSQLSAFTTAFKPAVVPEHMRVEQIFAGGGSYAIWHRSVTGGAQINFIWAPVTSTEVHMNNIFGRGEIAGYMLEHNGIEYAVTEWVDRNTQEPAGYAIIWVQHGYGFTTSATAGVTLEEALAFSYAVPIESWQLDGDAVSVSIQDMEDVTIVALSDGIGRSGIRQEIRRSGDNLYLVGTARDGGLELIGYRWLIDAAANRYQYVLAPGIYEFRASGATINSELLVRHFEAGEVALITDFTAEVSDPDVTEFTMIVTPDEVYDFTAEPDEPIIGITGEAEDITSTSATLSGSLANNQNSVEYGFYWGTVGNPSNRVVIGVTDSASLNFTFDLAGLTPNTIYFFRAFAGASRGEVLRFITEPDEPEQVTPYILVHVGEEMIIEGEILELSDDRAWTLEIEVFPSEDIVTGQTTVTASDPEVWIEEWNGAFLISGSAWSIFEPALITVTVPTVNGDIEKSFYVSFYSVVVR